MVFLCGQEFYPAAKFPSLDFSLVYPLDQAGGIADLLIDKRGPRAQPSRTLNARERERLGITETLEVRPGRVGELGQFGRAR